MRSTPWRPGADLTRFAESSTLARLFSPVIVLVALVLGPRDAFAMHLADGVLPARWCAAWTLLALPFVIVALRRYELRRRHDPLSTPLLAMVGAAVFAISCMPVPVLTAGTCSHPCGTGLAAVLIGPGPTFLVTLVALILQALFLAHGGVTTLGADVLSMGVVGGLVGFGAFRLARRAGLGLSAAGFLAGLLSDWATYAMTSIELALGLHGDRSVIALFFTVGAAFVPTQLPLGILEGLLTAGAIRFVAQRRPDLLARLLGAEPGTT